MKSIGIIGGIGPESTIVYYRSIIEQYQKKSGTKNFPELTLRSINLKRVLGYVSVDDKQGLTEYLVQHLRILEHSGVDYLALASNTPHIVFDCLAQKLDIPIISIVTATCEDILSQNVKKVALFGSKSTMLNGFYQKMGDEYGIQTVIPKMDDLEYIHEKYMGEIIYKNIKPETKSRFMKIAESLRRKEQVEGLILGGTELPFILKQGDFENFQIFDTTQIHVATIVRKMLEQ